MAAGLASAAFVRKAAVEHTRWLHRVALFIMFLTCGVAIFVFGSSYFTVFPTNRNLAYNALMGSGAFVRFVFADEMVSILGWVTGILFIPSLALVLGVLTASSKVFEVVYVLWMYMIIQRVPASDFVGMTAASPWYVYAPVALVLLLLAVLARRCQLKHR